MKKLTIKKLYIIFLLNIHKKNYENTEKTSQCDCLLVKNTCVPSVFI